MQQLTSGSLFSGYGGLTLAVEHVFNARTLWHAEWEDAPSKILARHWPDIPNLRDVTAIDWHTVPHVDILEGGFPCQDVSLAGRRAGMTEGTRSNLWGAFRTAIEIIRPRLVVAENVKGIRSARADSASDLEPGNGPMGDPRGGSLRALGRVLGDLADLGYDAAWQSVRASDVGSCHARERVFILAWDATVQDPHDLRSLQSRAGAGVLPAPRAGARPPADPRSAALRELAGSALAEEAGQDTGDRPADHHGARPPQDRRAAPADPGGEPRIMRRATATGEAQSGRALRERRGRGELPPVEWGPYGPAVHRWEHALGRPAPAPTEPNSKGKPRLSPAFTEWMMGLPEGWVTDTPGLKRADYLTACGNGVVPQQAAHALTRILDSLHTLPPAHTKEAHDA